MFLLLISSTFAFVHLSTIRDVLISGVHLFIGLQWYKQWLWLTYRGLANLTCSNSGFVLRRHLERVDHAKNQDGMRPANNMTYIFLMNWTDRNTGYTEGNRRPSEVEMLLREFNDYICHPVIMHNTRNANNRSSLFHGPVTLTSTDTTFH